MRKIAIKLSDSNQYYSLIDPPQGITIDGPYPKINKGFGLIDQIVANLNIDFTALRRAAVLNLPETGLGDNWRMCQVAEIPMFTTRGSVHGWNDRRRDSLFRKASHRSTEANVFGFGLQTAL